MSEHDCGKVCLCCEHLILASYIDQVESGYAGEYCYPSVTFLNCERGHWSEVDRACTAEQVFAMGKAANCEDFEHR